MAQIATCTRQPDIEDVDAAPAPGCTSDGVLPVCDALLRRETTQVGAPATRKCAVCTPKKIRSQLADRLQTARTRLRLGCTSEMCRLLALTSRDISDLRRAQRRPSAITEDPPAHAEKGLERLPGFVGRAGALKSCPAANLRPDFARSPHPPRRGARKRATLAACPRARSPSPAAQGLVHTTRARGPQ